MRIIFFIIFSLFFLQNAYCCKPGEFIPGVAKEIVSVFCAPEFEDAVKEIAREFENKNTKVQLYLRVSGSRELGYIIKEKKFVSRVDIIISSSPEVIEDFLLPEYLDWYITFGKDELCLAFTQKSKYSNQINEKNWHKVISQKGVKISRVDENLDPLGYRTLISWKLADSYFKENISQELFKNCLPANIYPKEDDIVLSLKAGDADYSFEYLSIAKRESLRFIKLPPQINLGDTSFLALYDKASVSVSSKERNRFIELKGKPITFAIGFLKGSISKDWPKKFFKFLFSQEAQNIFKKYGVEIDLRYCQGSITQEFKELCLPKE
ncbi:MAG: substrate-binding domain-containing protein [Candidatus Omnitrophica bacterium]|nr:substrate-binding domain-containing protein [Candidatus Omnitrophota bacterium]